MQPQPFIYLLLLILLTSERSTQVQSCQSEIDCPLGHRCDSSMPRADGVCIPRESLYLLIRYALRTMVVIAQIIVMFATSTRVPTTIGAKSPAPRVAQSVGRVNLVVILN